MNIATQVLLVAAVCAMCVLSVPMKPTKVYLRAMEAAMDAEDALLICRSANFTEHLKDIECFQRALKHFEYNASWAKQAGALYVMTAQRRKAYAQFNHSYHTILDAQGMINNAKVPSMPPVTLLKLYHAREKAGSLELAKVWFQALQMEHRTGEAKKLIDDFIEPLEDYSESTDLFRVVGSIVDVVKVKQEWRRWKAQERAKRGKKATNKEKETTINIVAEELLRMAEELSNRWLSAPLTATQKGRDESLAFSKSSCGIGFVFKDTYTIAELVQYLSVCLAKWGELRQHLEQEGTPEPYGALLRTTLHTVAAYGTEVVVRTLVESFPDLVRVVDNFGSTPLHIAAAHGNRRAMHVLAKVGGMEVMKHKDAGGFSPLHLGCSNKYFRGEMVALMEKHFGVTEACGPYTITEKFADDTIEDDEDDTLTAGGGWKGAEYRGEHDCAFDVRSGTSMSHHELIGRYLHSSRPIVLRGVIPAKIRQAMQRKQFIPAYHDLWLRDEDIPAAELYGNVLHNITTIRGWTKNNTGKFGTIEVNKRHALSKLIHWLPEKLVPPKDGYTTTDDSWPMLILSGKGARSNYVFRSSHYAHAVVHGVQHWTVVSPVSARTTNHAMRIDESEPNSMKCTLQSGDFLVLPATWGGAYWTPGESIGFSRRFIWK
jgi:hypothetical protein